MENREQDGEQSGKKEKREKKRKRPKKKREQIEGRITVQIMVVLMLREFAYQSGSTSHPYIQHIHNPSSNIHTSTHTSTHTSVPPPPPPSTQLYQVSRLVRRPSRASRPLSQAGPAPRRHAGS